MFSVKANQSLSCVVNLWMWILEFCLGREFYNSLSTGDFWVAGVIEWTLTFIGALYIFTFAGYLRYLSPGYTILPTVLINVVGCLRMIQRNPTPKSGDPCYLHRMFDQQLDWFVGALFLNINLP